MQFLTNTNIDFVGRRKIAAGISVLVILAGIVSLIAHGGPNLSIDFRGGPKIGIPELIETSAPTYTKIANTIIKIYLFFNNEIQLLNEAGDSSSCFTSSTFNVLVQPNVINIKTA